MGNPILVTFRFADPFVGLGTSSAPVIFGSRPGQQ